MKRNNEDFESEIKSSYQNPSTQAKPWMDEERMLLWIELDKVWSPCVKEATALLALDKLKMPSKNVAQSFWLGWWKRLTKVQTSIKVTSFSMAQEIIESQGTILELPMQ